VAQWSFLTNHARVLLCIAHDPGLRLRDMAEALGITERSAFAIVADLTDAGYVLKERDGRRNRYSIQRHMPLPDSTGRERTVGEVLNLLVASKSRPRTTTAGRVRVHLLVGRPPSDEPADPPDRQASSSRGGTMTLASSPGRWFADRG
jgi:DNA-binding transcriptional ArsR family regulator